MFTEETETNENGSTLEPGYVMPKKLAEAEINSWLDTKKIKNIQRKENEGSIETLVEAFMDGTLSLNPQTNVLKLNLLFPIVGKEASIDSLSFKPRLNDSMLHPHLNGVKPTDVDGRVNALICALTAQPKNIITILDSVDKRVAQAIAIFFL